MRRVDEEGIDAPLLILLAGHNNVYCLLVSVC